MDCFQPISINKLSYYLPELSETNSDLAKIHPDWNVELVAKKTGIHKRYKAGKDETALDLAVKASEILLNEYQIEESSIDCVILVTQSPEYVLPTTACILQQKLSLRKNILAFDINLGCSGFVNALAVATSMISSKLIKNCLLICTETYSKYIDENDRTNKMIFSDAAAACLVEYNEKKNSACGGFEFGSDGSGCNNLIVRGRASRQLKNDENNFLHMNGASVLMFTMREVPKTIQKTLKKCNMSIEDIDLFVLHQASNLVINELISKLKVKPEKVFNNLSEIGNTVSCTIPIALKDAINQKKIVPGSKILIAGFGVGLSWGAAILKWPS